METDKYVYYMRCIFTYLLLVFSLIGFAQNPLTLPIINNPLPTDTLRILLIGNSFTDDVTEYIGEIVQNSGIDEKTCCVYRVTQGGSQLQTWRDKYKNNAHVSLEKRAGLFSMDITEGTLKEILHQQWDVVSLQQLSNYSDDITTFTPYLEDLLSYITQDCLNKQVAICWHLTWSYWEGHTAMGPKEFAGWEKIVSAVEQMTKNYGIDIIIPSGTAIQNARATELNTDKSLTRDGYHIDYGVGRYIIACTLYETLFTPVYGKSIENIFWHPQQFSDTIAFQARECAIKAVDDWHKSPLKSSEETSMFFVFPNPITDSVFIYFRSTSETVHCTIHDITGKKVFKEKIATNKVSSIDMSYFPKGLYIIQLKSDSVIKTQRIEKL